MQQTFHVLYHLFPFPSDSPRGAGKAVVRFLHCAFVFTAVIQFILSGMSGITSHLASQAHAVARNTHLITLAVCTLPVPFKNLICTGIGNEQLYLYPFNPIVDHSLAWHSFLIDEDIHGPAVNFTIHKAANSTSAVLALVWASDLSQRHEISDKLKEFLQCAWACELKSGAHLALVKTMIDE